MNITTKLFIDIHTVCIIMNLSRAGLETCSSFYLNYTHRMKGAVKMAGSLSIHPLLKTYDELRKSRNRIINHVKATGPIMHQKDVETLMGIANSLKDMIDLIPEEFRKNSYEVRKQYKESRD